MNRNVLAAAAALLSVCLAGPAAAQTKYFARSNVQMAGQAAAAAATPKTLTCGGAMVQYSTPYPYTDVQGPLTTAATVADGRKACNQMGKQYGEIFKDYNYCFVAPIQVSDPDTKFYVYLYKASAVYSYDPANTWAKNYVTMSCTYNP